MSSEGNLTFRSLVARQIIKEAINEAMRDIPVKIPDFPGDEDGDREPIIEKPSPRSGKTRVCIIGAGMAGLRTAMYLDRFKDDFEYEIFEASDRHGGRVHTYHFTDTKDYHDYYDLGAMRFPDIKTLHRTFALFKELGLTDEGKIIPYIYTLPQNIELFNKRKVTKAEAVGELDPFKDAPHIAEEWLAKTYRKRDGTTVTGVDACLAAAYEPFKDKLVDDFCTGWAHMMEYDSYSTREYLCQEMGYPFSVVQWMERMDTSTGTYDLAFTETILESIDFDYPFGSGKPRGHTNDQKWFCVDGGTSVVPDTMCRRILNKPIYNHRVSAIRMQEQKTGNPAMFIKFQGQKDFHEKSFDHIISTVPLSCVNSMDITQAGLTYDQDLAIRALGYGAAAKIGIKFKTRWWQTEEFNCQRGGVSSTDMPIRIVVYPSYGFDDAPDAPGVLIASYTWTQDSSRLGAYMRGRETQAEKDLLDIVYNNLAAMHGKTADWYREQTVDYYPWDWYQNEFSVGAYAQFHAGQFRHLYRHMTIPGAKGHLHFAGEAISTHHAWIEGALESTWRPVHHLLVKEGRDDLIKDFLKTWPVPEEVVLKQESWQVLRGIYEAPQ